MAIVDEARRSSSTTMGCDGERISDDRHHRQSCGNHRSKQRDRRGDARLLAERGARVVLGARRTERLDDIAGEIRNGGGVAITCRTDVTRREDLERLVGSAIDEFG
jgi:hypothetical protein